MALAGTVSAPVLDAVEPRLGEAARPQGLVERQFDARPAQAGVLVDARRDEPHLALIRSRRSQASPAAGSPSLICASLESGSSASSSIRPSRAMRKYGVAEPARGNLAGTDGSAAGSMPPTGARSVMRDWRTFISLTIACEAASDALAPTVSMRRCSSSSFEKAPSVERLGALELALLEVDVGLLGGERRFGLRDLRLQQRVVQPGQGLALLHPVALVDIDRRDAIAGEFGADRRFLAHHQPAGRDDLFREVAHARRASRASPASPASAGFAPFLRRAPASGRTNATPATARPRRRSLAIEVSLRVVIFSVLARPGRSSRASVSLRP